MQKKRITDGKMGVMDTVAMAMGFAVGSGVITMTGVAIGITGRSVMLSYILTAVMFLLAVIPTLIMGTVHPTRSASYVYSKELLHPKVGGLYMYVYFLGRLTISVFGISCAQYLASLFPYINQKLTAIAILTFFFVINLFGTPVVAKVQNVMFYILITALGTFIVAGMMKVDVSAYFAMDGFYVNGLEGVWQASALLVFAVGGGGVLVDFGSSIRNPQKVIPAVVIGVTSFVAFAYAMLSMVAAGLLPYEQVAFRPLTDSAGAVFGETSILYVLFICGGALLALTTTLNSSFLWYTNAMMKGCEEGWFSSQLVKLNRFKVPYRLTTIFYLFGLIPTVLGMDITMLSKMAVALTTMMWMIPVFGLVNCPKRYPKEWQASKFAKMPTWLLWALATLSFVIYGSQTWSLLRDNPVMSNVIIVIYLTGVLIYIFRLSVFPGMEYDYLKIREEEL